MALDLTALKAELNRNKDVDDSAKQAMETLLAAVEANKGNPTEIQAIVDEWRGQNDSLAAAVANTSGTPGGGPRDVEASVKVWDIGGVDGDTPRTSRSMK